MPSSNHYKCRDDRFKNTGVAIFAPRRLDVLELILLSDFNINLCVNVYIIVTKNTRLMICIYEH